MRKKIVLGTVLTLSVLIVAIVVGVAPALAAQKKSNITLYGTGARVGFSVPTPGGSLKPGHPTDFNIAVWDFGKHSDTGAFDLMQIQVWCPGRNISFVVALVLDIPIPDWLKQIWNGTNSPVYYETSDGVVRNNIFQVADKELDVGVQKEHSSGYTTILTANLTVPVQIKGLPALYGVPDFTLPPMMLQFREIAEGCPQTVQNTPNNWVWTILETKVPAFVEVTTPLSRGAPLELVGHLSEHGIQGFTPPP